MITWSDPNLFTQAGFDSYVKNKQKKSNKMGFTCVFGKLLDIVKALDTSM